MTTANMSVREAFVKASSFLGEQGVAEASSCTELLLQHLLVAGHERNCCSAGGRNSCPKSWSATWHQLVATEGRG